MRTKRKPKVKNLKKHVCMLLKPLDEMRFHLAKTHFVITQYKSTYISSNNMQSKSSNGSRSDGSK